MIDDPVHILDNEALSGQPLENNQLFITDEIRGYWRKSSKWAAAIVTVGYVMLAIFAVFFGFAFIKSTDFGPALTGLSIGLPILIWAFLLFTKLYQYSVKVKHAADYTEHDDMEMAFKRLKSAYSMYGIAALLLVALVACLVFWLLGKSLLSNF